MAVTIKDVALLARVSRSAVSRTFTDGASVSDKMRKKVEKAAAELNYSPNILARSLTTRRTKLIGLVSNNFDNPFFLQVFDLFTRGLQEVGLRPLLVNLTSETNPAHSVRMLRQYSVDGVIVAASELPSSFSRAFREAGLPVVHSFGGLNGSPDVHTVGIDDRQCGRIAAQLLIDKGYRSIGFMGGPKNTSVNQGRLKGFMDVTSKHPEISVAHSFSEAHSFTAGRQEMTRLLQGPHGEAYFCADDVLSIGAISAIQSAGFSVPKDIGIIGLNNMEMAGWENINLTTIHQPVKQIVTSSIDMIEAILDDPGRYPETRMFSCALVERGTLRNGTAKKLS